MPSERHLLGNCRAGEPSATAEAVGTTLNTAVGTALVQDTTADVHGLTRTSSSAGTATVTLSKADETSTPVKKSSDANSDATTAGAAKGDANAVASVSAGALTSSATEAPHNRVVALPETYIDVN